MTKLLTLAYLSTFGHVALAMLVNSSSTSVRVNLLARSPRHKRSQGACGTSPSFLQFVSMYGRTYSREEYATRRGLFESRVADIEAHNCHTTDRLWHATVNPLTDRTHKELAAMEGRSRARYADAEMPVRNALLQTTKKRRAPLAADTNVGYKHLKAMKTIRDQGSCGSCWAQATTSMLWAHKEIYHADDAPLSTDQLVSCVPNPQKCGGEGGCSGATSELALDYVMHNGLENENKFHSDPDRCPAAFKAKSKRPIPQPTSGNGAGPASAFGMVGWEKLPENKQEPLIRAVYERGPVAVSATSGANWYTYGGGVFNGCQKDGIINHLVVLVGFGNEHNKKYWTIQNSWGSEWGESGFMRILRQDDETAHCGWDHKPQDGVACEDGPSKVKICGMCGILYDATVPHFEGNSKQALMMYQRRKE